MKNKLLITSALAVATFASVASADLIAPGATQLDDYSLWFNNQNVDAPNGQWTFKIESDATVFGEPSPAAGTPVAGTYTTGAVAPLGAPINTAIAQWSGWTYPVATLPGPITNSGNTSIFVETVFLGETAGWLNDFGYRISGGPEVSLAKDIKAPSSVKFGDFLDIEVKAGETLDFFFVGTEESNNPDGVISPAGPTLGGKYWLFGTGVNAGTLNAGYGILDPLFSLRGPGYTAAKRSSYTVVGLEDFRNESTSYLNDKDANDFLFAFRVASDSNQSGVPEPSTYGLMGAAVLASMIGYRRFKASRKA